MESRCQVPNMGRCANFYCSTRLANRARQNQNSKKSFHTADRDQSHITLHPQTCRGLVRRSGALPPVQADMCLAAGFIIPPSQRQAVESTPTQQLPCCWTVEQCIMAWQNEVDAGTWTDNMPRNRASSASPSSSERGKVYNNRTHICLEPLPSLCYRCFVACAHAGKHTCSSHALIITVFFFLGYRAWGSISKVGVFHVTMGGVETGKCFCWSGSKQERNTTTKILEPLIRAARAGKSCSTRGYYFRGHPLRVVVRLL